ncbi:MAG: UbiA family prenyltransferase [Bacteroidia bacterium]|nr:UbiA family prenyltransferase [Bacteroidia bacterium]
MRFIAKALPYFSLVKFSHSVFALPFAAIGFALGLQAQHAMPVTLGIKVVLCMVFARNAAMAFNRWADKYIDAQNSRTSIREIPAGIIKPSAAAWFTLLNSMAFIFTTYFINSACFYLSFVALAVVLGYSYTKRFTPLCHLVLGLGLSLAPIGAYIAVTGVFNFIPLMFSAIVLFWVCGFDIIYALQDIDFDRSQQLKSIPVLLGINGALTFARICHFMCAVLLIATGVYAGFAIWYWVGTALFIALLIYQHLLVKADDFSKINLAFFTTNGIGSLVFGFFVIIDISLS